MPLSFQNPNFQTIAKVQAGQTYKYKFANLRSLLNEEEKRNNGKCTYRELLQSATEKPQTNYCDITFFLAQYTDPKTGLKYYDQYVYQYLKNLDKGKLLQYQELHKFVDIDQKI